MIPPSAQTRARSAKAAAPAKRKDLLSLAAAEVNAGLKALIDHLGEPRRSDGPIDGHAVPDGLRAALRYALLTPGKRIRPALVLGGALAVDAKPRSVLPAACAVEMIHAYSLVHDDLPALDNDDMRRGQPSCHRRFDEPTALLAGDALLTEAFSLLADNHPVVGGAAPTAGRRAQAVLELARAAGAAGMVGGQQEDVDRGLTDGARAASAYTLRSIHRRKTGRLIQASVALGGICGGGNAGQITALRAFGAGVGLAFQLVDDALDRDGLALLASPKAAREEAQDLTNEAIAQLQPLARSARPLVDLALRIVERKR